MVPKPTVMGMLILTWLLLQVCWWDLRCGGSPVGLSSIKNSHKDPVYETAWLGGNKIEEQFFTASSDGSVSTLSH